ncbi:unnamed protein product [Effrenium voratum]|uniref:EF-hand domain-containing protein n=1 Tax=Effrenium voratum TaxID=2562239 RepID=A0AA36JLN7_9DINO|nr:unnamed protein product [Effrenium voratum]
MTGEKRDSDAGRLKSMKSSKTAKSGKSARNFTSRAATGKTITRQFSVSVYTERDLEMMGDSRIAGIAYSTCFLTLTIFIIVCNAIWMLIDVEWNHPALGQDGQSRLAPADLIVENLFCSFFFVEIFIRLLAFRRWTFATQDTWFLFDAVLVVLMVLETWLLPFVSIWLVTSEALNRISIIRLFRLLRLGRIFRMLRFHPELRLLAKSIVRAMHAVFYILFLLVLVTYFFAIVFTTQLGVPGTPRAGPFDEPTAQQLFSDMGSSMMSLFTYGTLADELASAFHAIKAESALLFWLFTLFVVISGITLLNMLIGVLCQVVEDNSREHEKQKMLVDLKSSLEEAFEALDTSHDGKISEEEFQMMRTDPNVMDIFFRLGMEEEAMVERLNHMQETIFAGAKDDAEESAEPPKRVQSLSFNQFCDQVIEMQMGSAAGVLDVQLLAAKVRQEDQKIRKTLSRLEPEVRKVLGLEIQEERLVTETSLVPASVTFEDPASPASPCSPLPRGSFSEAPKAPPLAPMLEEADVRLPENLPGELPEAEEGYSLSQDWLREVPTELLLYTLKARAGPEVIY